MENSLIDVELLRQNVKKKGLKLKFVASELGLSKVSFHRRLVSGMFKKLEIKALKQLKLI